MVRAIATTAERGKNISIHGWVMEIRPFYTADRIKFGEELFIKTVANKDYGGEIIPIYIGNVIIRKSQFTENLKPLDRPIPVFVEGKKRGEKAYNNIDMDGIESSKKILWVFLYMGTKIKRLNSVPDDVLNKWGTAPPSMTFAQYRKAKHLRMKKYSDDKHGN